jgi:hypothetical protein
LNSDHAPASSTALRSESPQVHLPDWAIPRANASNHSTLAFENRHFDDVLVQIQVNAVRGVRLRARAVRLLCDLAG